MRLKRCSQGLCLLVVLLSWAAFALDDPAILFGGMIILVAILGQAILFDRQFRAAVASVSVERKLERTVVRRGTTLGVTTFIRLDVPDHLEIRLTEMLPETASLQDGEISTPVLERGPRRQLRLAYWITATAHGTRQFRGICLRASNRFFEDRIELTVQRFREPVLQVQPRSFFEAQAGGGAGGTMEIEKVSHMTGFGVRSIRDYLLGDDLRRVDWKLSAKHDRLLIREYSAVISFSPLIIVDLPLRDTPYSRIDFERMVAAVAGIVEKTVRASDKVSVLLVSGPNILHLIEKEKDLDRCLSELREWLHPAEQNEFFYRFSDRSELREHLRRISSGSGGDSTPGKQQYHMSLGRILTAALQEQRTPAFFAQLGRILAGLGTDEVFYFSLSRGDTSTLRQIIRLAGKKKAGKIHLRIPVPTREERSAGMRMGADSVEDYT